MTTKNIEEGTSGGSALTVGLGDAIRWTKSVEALPEFNRLILAHCDGVKEHSGVLWKRSGFAFMVRHDDTSAVVADKWAPSFYEEALTRIGADFLEVTHWAYLNVPNA